MSTQTITLSRGTARGRNGWFIPATIDIRAAVAAYVQDLEAACSGLRIL